MGNEGAAFAERSLRIRGCLTDEVGALAGDAGGVRCGKAADHRARGEARLRGIGADGDHFFPRAGPGADVGGFGAQADDAPAPGGEGRP